MNTVVACVFVEGHVHFTSEYVIRLKSMVARHLSREHRFICLTDRPWMLERYTEVVQIPKPEIGVYGWWSKLHLFDRTVLPLQSGRCLYLDLDTIVVESLDEIVDFDAPLALIPDGAPNFKGKGARKTVKAFNSSVMVWNGGQYNNLYETFHAEVPERLWGDQDWIGEHYPNAAKFPSDWFPRISECPDGPLQNAKVILCKKPKNVVASLLYSWFREVWQ